jgi:hypothetical protein
MPKTLIVPPKLFIGGKESPWNHSPPLTVNNFAPTKKMTVNNSTFTRRIKVNTPGPEDEYENLNVRRLTVEFRSGPGALMQRNPQSLSPASPTGRDEPSIRVLSCSGNIFFENYSPLAGAAFLIMPASGLPCLAKAVS